MSSYTSVTIIRFCISPSRSGAYPFVALALAPGCAFVYQLLAPVSRHLPICYVCLAVNVGTYPSQSAELGRCASI